MRSSAIVVPFPNEPVEGGVAMAQDSPTLRRQNPPHTIGEEPPRPVLLGQALLALLVGVGMGSLVVGHLVEFGSQGPLVQQMLALGANGGGATSLQAAAADSGSHLLQFGALVLATGSALALLLGAGLGLLHMEGGPTAHRAVRIGLWMSLAVCLLALLPLDGAPFALGYTHADPGDAPTAAQWHPVLQVLAVAAAGGLLLSAVGFRRGADHHARRS
jgi:hypothetical protein